MPGPHKDTYATATLSICIFTTVICGGMTKHVLDVSGMKQTDDDENEEVDGENLTPLSASSSSLRLAYRAKQHVYHGAKAKWREFDNNYLRVYFGGATSSERHSGLSSLSRGDYELTTRQVHEGEDDNDGVGHGEDA